jgi:hypothetical protein
VAYTWADYPYEVTAVNVFSPLVNAILAPVQIEEFSMRTLVFAILLSAAFMVQADVLKMQGQDAEVVTSGSVPVRGMSKSDVLRQYGEPGYRKPAVGKPPISRWDYPGYSVFFEYNIVLHTVVHQG